MLTKTEQTLEIYSKRGKEGKRLERVYRQLFRKELYKTAYAEIYANDGATTRGIDKETLDGMSEERMDKIIEKIKVEQYRWKPVRRTYIPKEDGRKRPLGIPTGDDKLLQAALKILLEAYYEPTFSNRSHGFRRNRGCHTALIQMGQKHHNTNWFIEGDIKGCFDNIDHETLLGIMEEKIDDGRVIGLVRKLLKAGYMEGWRKGNTYSGTPQGGIISPLLTNIYMDVFDKWVEKELMPKYNRSLNPKGGRRKNLEYTRLSYHAREAGKKGDLKAQKEYRKQRGKVSSVIENDEGYRKLEYVRYADDFLLSFAGPKAEAEEIKEEIREFLAEKLKLELSAEKTLITHARTERAKFLGYEISIFKNNPEYRRIAGKIKYGVPKEVIKNAIKRLSKNGKPIHRTELMEHSDLEIIWQFQTEYKGLVEYYKMAHNIHNLSEVGNAYAVSLTKTLASKHKTTVRKVYKKYQTTHKIEGKEYKVLEARKEREGKKPLIVRFGGVSLSRNPLPVTLSDEKLKPMARRSSELIHRLEAGKCEMCGEEKGNIETHHVRKLKDINKQGRKKKLLWERNMSAMRRKTMMCCRKCHKAIHRGESLPEWEKLENALESRVQ